MALSKEQEELYKKILADTKEQLEAIDELIEKEIQKVREKLAELQESKKAIKMVYLGAAKLLGIESELEEDEQDLDAAADMPKM